MPKVPTTPRAVTEPDGPSDDELRQLAEAAAGAEDFTGALACIVYSGTGMYGVEAGGRTLLSGCCEELADFYAAFTPEVALKLLAAHRREIGLAEAVVGLRLRVERLERHVADRPSS